ncbi:hypothetical protein [Streptomyces sp. NPDC127039]|uniref:hypothetical protein n=1 Tax=Streptomyces sp. NPDC127039 TaxID=3347115 RepID=UPI0036534399
MTQLALHATAAVRSPEGTGPAGTPEHLGFFEDLLGPFGAKPDEELLRSGRQVTHRHLADRLVDSEAVRGARPQLLIVAYALPDVVPFTAVAPHLTERLGGEAVNFALSQQGLAAPFTALRIADAHARSGRAAEVVLAVLEQTTLPVDVPLVREKELTDSAAALVLRAASGPGGGGLRLGRVGSGALPDGLDGDGTLHVLGPCATGSDVPHKTDVHRAPSGTYCTGVWLELAAHWQEWQRSHHTVVLRDTEPGTGREHHAVFTTAPAAA